jgi:hypothetical protein
VASVIVNLSIDDAEMREPKISPGEVTFQAVCQMAAAPKVQCKSGLPRLQHGVVGSLVRLAAGVRLKVRVIRRKNAAGDGTGQGLDLIVNGRAGERPITQKPLLDYLARVKGVVKRRRIVAGDQVYYLLLVTPLALCEHAHSR